MKGEYVDTKNENPTNMFSKLHPQHQHQHHHHQQQQQQQQHQHLPFSHHFQLSRECHTSEDDDSHSRSTGGATPTTTTQAQKPETTSTGDGATIEVVRRPRGRPPGSKNKPKPPVFITRDPEPAMSPYILEVPGGTDIIEVIARFCNRKNIGLCVLTGSGSVANVTLRQPSSTPGATITFHGRFDILSISATFLPQTVVYQIPNIFTISISGPQGQIVGGSVAGALIAAGTVYVVAATFNNPTYHRLPMEEDTRNSVSGGGGGEGQSPPGSAAAGGGGEGGHVADSCGMSMYSCHLPGNDVIWAPTARPPQQQQQPPPY